MKEISVINASQSTKVDFVISGEKSQARKTREILRAEREKSSQMPQFASCSIPRRLYIQHVQAVSKLVFMTPSQMMCTAFSYTSLMLMGAHAVPSCAPRRSWQLRGQHCSTLLTGSPSPASVHYKRQPLTLLQGKLGISRNHVCITRGLRGSCFSHRQGREQEGTAKRAVPPLVLSGIW